MNCDRLIAIAAFRYALGRASYIVSHVADWLIANRDQLTAHDRAMIVREIGEMAERDALGHDCDIRDWERVREAMQ